MYLFTFDEELLKEGKSRCGTKGNTEEDILDDQKRKKYGRRSRESKNTEYVALTVSSFDTLHVDLQPSFHRTSVVVKKTKKKALGA